MMAERLGGGNEKARDVLVPPTRGTLEIKKMEYVNEKAVTR